ncbi:hypothetical protein CMI40_02585 [Candidatus Pacearchaeota archaeon]|jgi:mRNA-degrading endonuclease RelE of RelBE toxin-antitoxin system|nr:hypothetical protein [Candidatus Pacearchaeota archaeon]|tara:strand:+ start:8565 stop:8816 length:252 start_codon:yes stop_codon:yes gene_type:complete
MYEAVFSNEFKKQLKKLKKKDKSMYERLEKKIKNILIEPSHFKHLRNVLKDEQRTQLGPFVLRFKVSENRIYFITFRHHDFAY